MVIAAVRLPSVRRIGLGIVAAGGLALVAAPRARGHLLGLDWSSGPADPLPAALFGPADGRAFFAPVVLVRRALRSVIFGLDPVVVVLAVLGWLAWRSFRRLISGSLPGAVGATLLFLVNPFVADRLAAAGYGQLIGYLLLPLIFERALRPTQDARSVATIALCLAVGTAGASQFLLFGLLPVACAALASSLTAPRSWRPILGLLATLLSATILCAYWLVPTLAFSSAEYAAIGRSDLTAFSMKGSLPHLAVGTISLGGNWRHDALSEHPGHVWVPFLMVIVGIAVLGCRAEWRLGRRREVVIVGLIALAGGLLALGSRGPTGHIFLGLYDHVPGFRMFREPGKAIGLVAVSFALAFGWGVRTAIEVTSGRRAKHVLVLALTSVPLLYAPAQVVDPFRGIRASQFPATWRAAQRTVQDRQGTLLALPWHQFLPYGFTGGRPVQNPAAVFFGDPVLVSDDPGLPGVAPASRPGALVGFLITQGEHIHHAGRTLAALGIQYVLLSHDADFRSYDWLHHQADLELVRSWSDLDLYRVRPFHGPVRAAIGTTTVADWGEAVALAEVAPIERLYVRVERATGGPRQLPAAALRVAAPRGTVVTSGRTRSSFEVRCRHALGLLVSKPFDRRWTVGTAAARPNLGATSFVPSCPSRDVVRLQGARLPMVGMAVSSVAAVGAAAVASFGSPLSRRRRRPSDHHRRDGDER